MRAPLRDAWDEIFGLIGISTDISARKAAEEELRRREAKLAEVQAVAQVASWEWVVAIDEGSWSEELYRIFGVDPDFFEPSYESFLAGVHPDDRSRVAAAHAEALEHGSDYEAEYRVVRPDGEIRTVFARGRIFTDLDGEPLRMVGAALDISEQKRSQERLQAHDALADAAEVLTRVGSFEWEIDTNEVHWSDGLYRIFGLEPGAFPGTFEAYLERVHPEEREARRLEVERVLETGNQANGEHRIVRPDGEVRWVESRIGTLSDERGRTTKLVGACQDITERKLAHQELEEDIQAAHLRSLRDPLTGLANRTLALDRLEHAFALAERRKSDLAVMFIDIDGFKRVNDRFGHQVGDSVLRSIAERLQTTVRGSDTVARIGGDEFLLVCEEAEGAVEALQTAERLREAFAARFDLQDFAEQITISIGVSSIGDRPMDSGEQLVAEADEAMYEAKRRGPGNYALYAIDAK
jgi:diguanylate cyclase (GGDEF)-like protein/PAS domain S-box-containing protein